MYPSISPAEPTRSAAHLGLKAKLPWLVLAISLGCTVLGWQFVRDEVRSKARLGFDNEVQDTVKDIRERMLAYEQVLRGGAGLFARSGTLTRREWHDYVQSLKLEAAYPGIQAFGYAPIVSEREKQAHVHSLHAEGFLGYRIDPQGSRQTYSPTVYVEPFAGRNRRVLGYDMLSEPIRRAALEQARNNGDAVLTGKVILVQETEQTTQAGTLLVFPVYRPAALTSTAEQRRAALQGYVYAAFRMTDLMTNTLRHADPALDVEIFDGAKPGSQDLLYDGDGVPHFFAAGYPTVFRKSIAMQVAGRAWTLAFMARPAYTAQFGSGKAPLVLAGGGIISLLLFGISWALATTRARAEQLARSMSTARHETEARLESIIQAAMDAVMTIDAQQNIVMFNPAAEKVFGYSANEAIGTPLDRLIPQRFRSAHRRHVETFGSTGTTTRAMGAELALFGLRANGAEFPIDASISQVEQGGKQFYTVILRDITRRKEAERALQLSEARFRSLTALSSDWYWEQDAEFRFTSVSGVGPNERAHPFTQSAVVGKQRWELAYLDVSEETWQQHRALLEAHQPFQDFELKQYDAAGKLLYVSLSGEPVFDSQGYFTGYRGVGRDITARKLAEHALTAANQFNQEIMASVNEGVVVYDRAMRVISWNRFIEDLTGIAAEHALGKNLYELFPALRAHGIDALLRRALAGETVMPDTLRARLRGTPTYLAPDYRADDSEERRVAWTASAFAPHRNQQGEVVGVIATVIDLTDLKRSQDALNRSNEKLRELAAHLDDVREEERGAIARELHDELGGQLTALKLDVAWLRARFEAPQLLEKVESMAQLIDTTVATVRRIAADLRPVMLDDLGLGPAIEWLVKEFQQRSGVKVDLDLCEAEPLVDERMAAAIYRIVQESLTNIARHAAASTARVALHCDAHALTLRISDDGRGMDPDAARKPHSFGLLGIRERALALGGRAEILSTPGAGTMIRITIPITIATTTEYSS